MSSIEKRSTGYNKEYAQFIKKDGSKKYNFAHAKEMCEKLGGQLLHIGSKGEQDYVHGLYAIKKKVGLV